MTTCCCTLRVNGISMSVSYTHLDVYKRQVSGFMPHNFQSTWLCDCMCLTVYHGMCVLLHSLFHTHTQNGPNVTVNLWFVTWWKPKCRWCKLNLINMLHTILTPLSVFGKYSSIIPSIAFCKSALSTRLHVFDNLNGWRWI